MLGSGVVCSEEGGGGGYKPLLSGWTHTNTVCVQYYAQKIPHYYMQNGGCVH